MLSPRAGLIPAHAGKTMKVAQVPVYLEAHPRSRGENSASGSSVNSRRGSSPLTRGKRSPGEAPRTRSRLIPAHAGKTVFRWYSGKLYTAHPRSRGENPHHDFPLGSARGSSPLTRGKHPGRPRCRSRHRLIPAHAGKTYKSTFGDFATWAHPRSRGENSSAKTVG